MARRRCRGLAADVFMPQRQPRQVTFSRPGRLTRAMGQLTQRPRPLPEQVLMAHLGLVIPVSAGSRDAEREFDTP
ncbi:MAG: hypothetical protein ACE5O2_08440 [Armatimonadota bacterium]